MATKRAGVPGPPKYITIMAFRSLMLGTLGVQIALERLHSDGCRGLDGVQPWLDILQPWLDVVTRTYC